MDGRGGAPDGAPPCSRRTRHEAKNLGIAMRSQQGARRCRWQYRNSATQDNHECSQQWGAKDAGQPSPSTTGCRRRCRRGNPAALPHLHHGWFKGNGGDVATTMSYVNRHRHCCHATEQQSSDASFADRSSVAVLWIRCASCPVRQPWGSRQPTCWGAQVRCHQLYMGRQAAMSKSHGSVKSGPGHVAGNLEMDHAGGGGIGGLVPDHGQGPTVISHSVRATPPPGCPVAALALAGGNASPVRVVARNWNVGLATHRARPPPELLYQFPTGQFVTDDQQGDHDGTAQIPVPQSSNNQTSAPGAP